ncbi:kelch motif-containing protein [Streptomyces gobiensis]|uniref:kelch motif-containing protein n=1 Tax=Streptomyces gobiensis TaxID=2875706 RepID=UPI001E4A02D0|nr:kelch motif-containing protein [Streptomyces gobiensis]UGY91587.1 kelch motif-containing protein [Streptomyces gobiensis]
MKYRPSRRAKRLGLATAAVLVVAGMNAPWLIRFGSEQYHQWNINRPVYKAQNGLWQVVDVPEKYKINTIHAALLHTGKVLLVAGSGNDAEQFKAKTFRSVLWDPKKNTFKNIPTPKDMFCAGHTQLPDGKLLIAGGTQRYETLEGDVEKAGGLMIVSNENPDKPMTLPKGTKFKGNKSGKTFVTQQSLLVPRAKKVTDPVTGDAKVTARQARIYVEAQEKGRKHATGDTEQYTVLGLKGQDRENVYGIANKLSFDKKDFQGIKESYEFDPVAERYIAVDPMEDARWYPTLTTLEDGRVLSVSGLDDIGEVSKKVELYDPATKKWRTLPKERYFPTYPGLFLADQGKIFYSGTSSGYGPADQGRVPGLWDWRTDKFQKIPGLSDPDALETSMAVLLPPAQDQRYMVLGGGGIGESSKVTDKTRIVDLKADKPRFTDGPRLYAPVRYPSSVILPDDTVLTTNGSGGYRGYSDSDVLKAELYNAKTNTSRSVADPLVGRNYHSGALLLPDGKVMTFGSDSLFADEANTKPGQFEQQIDIYSPPYLFRDSRPELRDGSDTPQSVKLGGKAEFQSKDADQIQEVRLIRPSSFTHVTNVEQRSIALEFEQTAEGVEVTLPEDPTLVPPGYYMVNVLDAEGTPSEAVWVHVPVAAPGEVRS